MIGNSVDWWTTTKASPKMFRPPGLSVEVEVYLLEHPEVDAHALAESLNMNVRHVMAHQRWLGIRKLAENNPKDKRRCR